MTVNYCQWLMLAVGQALHGALNALSTLLLQ